MEVQNDGEEEDKEGDESRRLHTALAFMCGLGRESMPRGVFREVMDLVIPSWDQAHEYWSSAAGATTGLKMGWAAGGGKAVAIIVTVGMRLYRHTTCWLGNERRKGCMRRLSSGSSKSYSSPSSNSSSSSNSSVNEMRKKIESTTREDKKIRSRREMGSNPTIRGTKVLRASTPTQ